MFRSTCFTRATSLNQNGLWMTPWAARESATAEKRDLGGTVTRSIGPGAGDRQAPRTSGRGPPPARARARWSRTPSRLTATGPPGVEEALQEHGGGQRVHVPLPASGRDVLLPHQPERPGGAESLVPELDRECGAPTDRGGERAGLGGARALVARGREREPDDDPDGAVRRD